MARVLVVDSDPKRINDVRDAVRAAGYDVALASSATYALTMLEWDTPDLVVSRADLADIDGFELCSLIRSDPKTQQIPFLLLADSTEPVAGQAARVGVDMVLVGRFVATDILRGIQRLL